MRERAITGSGHVGDVVDDQAWDRLIEGAPQGEIFHTSSWLKLVADVFDVQLTRLGLVDGEEVLAGLPLFGRRIGPLGLLGSPLPGTNTPQLGPVSLASGDERSLFESLDDIVRSERVSVTEIISAQKLDPAVLRTHSFKTVAHPTMVLELAGKHKDEVWKGLKSECRTACRKAEKSGVEIVEAENLDFFPEYLAMVAAVFKKQGRNAPVPPAFYLALWQRYQPTANLRVLLAWYRREIVAGSMFLTYKGQMYYLDGASYPERYTLRANDLIQWEAIQRAIEDGIERYDMVGADAPGLVRFKRSFGAEMVYHERARRVRSPLVELGLGAYLKTRPLMRNLRFRLSQGRSR